jgi:hypothetical protein
MPAETIIRKKKLRYQVAKNVVQEKLLSHFEPVGIIGPTLLFLFAAEVCFA